MTKELSQSLNMPPFSLQEWQKKRKTTLRVFLFQSFILGTEYSVTFLTLWIYVTTLVKTDHPKVFYSAVSSCYMLSSFVFSIIIGRWIDKTRSVRTTFFVCNTLVIVGNLIYVVHHSPWFLVVGRFMSGIGDPLRSVISGEIVRCFPKKEVSNRISAIGMASASGFIFGPAINFAFRTVTFNIGSLHITFANILGFYMAAFFLIANVLVYFFIHDLSKEYDLKACETSDTENDVKLVRKQNEIGLPLDTEESLLDHTDDNSNFKPMGEEHGKVKDPSSIEIAVSMERRESGTSIDGRSMKVIASRHIIPKDGIITSIPLLILQIITNFDLTFIFILSFFTYYWIVAFDMWLPMMVIDTLDMGVTELNGIVFGVGGIAAVLFFVFSRKDFTDRALFITCLICMVSLGVMQIAFGSMKVFKMKTYLYVLLWTVWGTLFPILMLMEQVICVGILAKMTSSKVQTFVESLRLMMSRSGSLIALLSSALVFDYVEYFCVVGVGVVVMVIIILLVRKRTLQNPQLILF